MPFTVFTGSTTAYASEVMDNFYHIAQGTRLPLGGVNLDPTTGVYNIGSQDYYWDELYCNSVELTSIPSKKLITSVYFSAAAQEIELSGFDGDDKTEYEIILNTTNRPSESQIGLIFNADTSPSYSYELFTFQTAGPSTTALNSQSSFLICKRFDTSGAASGDTFMRLLCSFCDTRAKIAGGWGLFNKSSYIKFSGFYYITAGAVTVIKFIGSTLGTFQPGASIELWG